MIRKGGDASTAYNVLAESLAKKGYPTKAIEL
jgi:hypothetical protein